MRPVDFKFCIAEKLLEFGIEVHSGLATTGVVGTLEGKSTGPSIAIRADMDALALNEETGLSYASKIAINILLSHCNDIMK